LREYGNSASIMARFLQAKLFVGVPVYVYPAGAEARGVLIQACRVEE
jgi:hypothetical protein